MQKFQLLKQRTAIEICEIALGQIQGLTNLHMKNKW